MAAGGWMLSDNGRCREWAVCGCHFAELQSGAVEHDSGFAQSKSPDVWNSDLRSLLYRRRTARRRDVSNRSAERDRFLERQTERFDLPRERHRQDRCTCDRELIMCDTLRERFVDAGPIDESLFRLRASVAERRRQRVGYHLRIEQTHSIAWIAVGTRQRLQHFAMNGRLKPVGFQNGCRSAIDGQPRFTGADRLLVDDAQTTLVFFVERCSREVRADRKST